MDPKKKPTYILAADLSSITCLVCGRESSNPNDVRFLYCGFCHKFHEAQP